MSRDGGQLLDRIESRVSFPPLIVLVAAAIALLAGGSIGVFGLYACAAVIGCAIFGLLLYFRLDHLVVTLVVAIHLYLDWYLGFAFAAQCITIVLLLCYYFMRSSHYPWTMPRTLWLWLIFLLLAIPSAFHGIQVLDTLYYYFNVIFIAPLFLWLGMVVSRDKESMRKLCESLILLGVLLAMHTIIQGATGVFLFWSSRYDTSLLNASFLTLSGSGANRAESLFLDPDSNGTFFAMIVFVALGLLLYARSLLIKGMYLLVIGLLLLALLFTYSTAAWFSCGIGMFIFWIFVGKSRYRLIIPFLLGIMLIAILIFLPVQVNAQLHHLGDSYEWPLRIGGWLTALNVIRAFPLTGLGMGRRVYIVRADPYRVPEQFVPLYHPHNSYLEFATQGGIPLALVFLILLIWTLCGCVRTWLDTPKQERVLIAGTIAMLMTLCINSFFNTGWTLSPLAVVGWIIVGAIASPLLRSSLSVK